MTIDERNRMELQADAETGKDQRIAALETELAAANERCAGLAAALDVGERTIAEAMKAASAMNLNKAGHLLSAYVMCGKDYSAILAAVREQAAKEEHLRVAARIAGPTYCDSDPVGRF